MNIGILSVGIEMKVDNLAKDADKASGVIDGVTGKLGGLASFASGGLVAGLAIGVGAVTGLTKVIGGLGQVAFDIATDIDGATGKVATGLGISKEEAEKFDGVMKNIYKNNYGQNFDDIAAAVVEVNRQLGDMPDSELQNIAEKSFAIRDAFGADIPETINAVDVLMEQFGLSSSEALDFIASGFQKGLNSSGDFLDTITEYGNQFGGLKVPAEEFFSILETGIQGGVLGTDKVADLFKEFGIRIMDGSDTTRDALSQIGVNYDTLMAQMASGSITGFDAFQMVQDKLAGLNDPILANQVGVGLMGTQFEDMGAAAVLAIDEASTKMDDLAGASDTLGEQYNTLGSVWEGLKRKAEVALAPVGKILLDGLKEVMPEVEGIFDWFGTTAVPKVEEFIKKATPILVDFFKKFDENFGPGVERLGEAIGRVAEALGLTEPGVSGLDGLLQALTKTLDGIVFIFDTWTRAVQAYLFVIEPTLKALRMIYDVVREIMSVGGSIGEALFNNARYNIRGFAEGGSFVVPPGYPDDSFLMGVTSGEYVNVTPANQVNDNRQVNLNISTRATQENVLHSYEMAKAQIP